MSEDLLTEKMQSLISQSPVDEGFLDLKVPISHDSRLFSPHQENTSTDVVVAEIPLSGTQLHHIATGKCCTMGYPGELFAVRFLLKNSFKSRKSK